MATHGRKMSFVDAINRLNVVAASALGAFFLVSLVMVGLASPIVDFLEAHRFLPMAISFMLMCIAFLSSGSRDPSVYHWFEKTFVVIAGGLMVMMSWTPFVDLVESFDPFGSLAPAGVLCCDGDPGEVTMTVTDVFVGTVYGLAWASAVVLLGGVT